MYEIYTCKIFVFKLIVLERLCILGVRHVEAQKHAKAFAPLKGLGFVPVDLVFVPETLPAEGSVKSVPRVVEFESPGASGSPGVSIENTADQCNALFPLFKVVAGGMDANDSFAVIDEVEDSFLLAFVGNEVGGVVKENGIILGEIFFCENAVVVGEINGETSMSLPTRIPPSSKIHTYVLCLREEFKRIPSPLSSNPAGFDASKRNPQIATKPSIDPYHAGIQHGANTMSSG